MRPNDGAFPITPIRAGEDVSTMLLESSIPAGVLLLTLALLTWRRFLDIHAPTDATYAKISFVAGVRSVVGVNIITAIPGFIDGVRQGWSVNSIIFVQKIRC